MLGLRRRPVKTHARLAREELNESIEHLVQAANHAAGGVGATVGPRVSAARERVGPAADRMRTVAAAGLGTTAAALAPLAVAARDGSRLAKRDMLAMKKMTKREKKSSGRWPRMALLAAGVAVGLAGAMVVRRRRQQQHWEEYDPSRPMESPADQASGVLHKAADTVSTTAETLAEKTSSAIDSATSARSASSGTPASSPSTATAPAPGVATPVPGVESPSSNSRS